MSAMTLALSDTSTMVARSVRRGTREFDVLLLAVLLPVMLMLLFVGVFGGAISPDGGYVDYAVPGVILLCVGYGAAQTAVSVAADMAEGVIDRFRTMPIAASSVLTGHVVASLLRNAVATVAVIAVAVALGFRPTAGPVEWIGVAGLLLLFVLAISWLSVGIGLATGNVEAASGFTFFVLFLPYVSSAFVPIETMPRFLQSFAEHQPATSIIETLRSLLMGTPNDVAWVAILWSVGLTVLGVAGSVVLFRRRRVR